MSAPPPSHSEIEQAVFGVSRPWYRYLVIGFALAALMLVAGRVTYGCHRHSVDAYLRDEITLGGTPRFDPPHPIDPAALARIDLERVHAELFPDWTIAASRPDRGGAAERERTAFIDLRVAVEADPNLGALLDELRQHVLSGEHAARGLRMIYLTWAWSHYLDQQGKPYILDGNVIVGARNLYYAKSYRVLGDSAARVGQASYRLRLLNRIDQTNVIEQYLGQARPHREGALVVIDRTRDFAIEHVWPLLDEDNEGWLRPIDFAFAAGVRAEARAQLPAVALALLRATARDRELLVRTRRFMHARRDCGSDLIVNWIPLDGFSEEDADWFTRVAARDTDRPCPRVKQEEARQLVEASARLRAAEGLGDAVGALVAWLARDVALHEARHVADFALARAHERPLPCRGCLEETPRQTRAELSAYLASLAWSEAPTLSFYQACRAVARERGPHHEALAFVLAKLDQRCESGPPADLTARARALELELFGRSDEITLPDDFPETLPLHDDGPPVTVENR